MNDVSDKHEASADDADQVPNRSTMVRDVVVFQMKLVADGFRDLLLVPVSIAAAIIALLRMGPKPGPEFYDVLRIGRRSEHWINLFGAVSQGHSAETDIERVPEEGIDDLIFRVESFVVEEYRRGEVTAQAKEKLDRALQILSRYRRRKETD